MPRSICMDRFADYGGECVVMSVWIVSTILVVALYLLITEKITVDLTAIGIIVALLISRVLSPLEAVAGFAHPAVITVGSMFLISRGMLRTGAVELIITPQSSLLGKQLRQSDLKRDPNLHIIAIKRSGLHYTEKQIHDINLKIGDIILAWCEVDKLERLREGSDFIVVEDVHHEIVQKRKAWTGRQSQTVCYSGVFRGQRLLRHTHRLPDQSAGIRTGRLPLQ